MFVLSHLDEARNRTEQIDKKLHYGRVQAFHQEYHFKIYMRIDKNIGRKTTLKEEKVFPGMYYYQGALANLF